VVFSQQEWEGIDRTLDKDSRKGNFLLINREYLPMRMTQAPDISRGLVNSLQLSNSWKSLSSIPLNPFFSKC